MIWNRRELSNFTEILLFNNGAGFLDLITESISNLI
jgi:hypothetical protein